MQQLKALYDQLLRPELLEEQSVKSSVGTTTPTPSMMGREKGKAGGRKERAGSKEKRGKLAKEESGRGSVSEMHPPPGKGEVGE